MSDFQTRFNELLASFKGNDTDVANLLGVTKQAVSNWRNGSRSPRKDTIIEIAKKFNVSIEWLMGFDEPSGEKKWEVEYPVGVALSQRKNPSKQPVGLTDRDIAAIANYLRQQTEEVKTEEAPVTPEARIVSFGMDQLPQQDRETILNMIRAMFSKRPEAKLFDGKEDTNSDA